MSGISSFTVLFFSMQTLIAECKGDMSTNAEFLFIFISKIRLLERTAIFMYANSFEEWWILMSFIIIRVWNKQYFFCYWLIFALSFSTMDSGRIGTWNQKHVFQIVSTLWKNGPKSNKAFVHFWHIFLTWYSDQKRNHQKSSKHLCKYWTKNLLDYKPISHMITGST